MCACILFTKYRKQAISFGYNLFLAVDQLRPRDIGVTNERDMSTTPPPPPPAARNEVKSYNVVHHPRLPSRPTYVTYGEPDTDTFLIGEGARVMVDP